MVMVTCSSVNRSELPLPNPGLPGRGGEHHTTGLHVLSLSQNLVPQAARLQAELLGHKAGPTVLS